MKKGGKKMNARERFIATMEFKEVDRPFRWETPGFWEKTILNWREEGLPDTYDLPNYFGMDKLVWMTFEGGWGGVPFCPMFDYEILEDDGTYITAVDRDGIIKKTLKYHPETSMPQFLKFPVESMGDFEEKIKWRLNYKDMERFPPNWDQLVKEYTGRDYPIGMFITGPFAHLRNLLGDENLMYMIYDEPELIKAIITNWLDFYLHFIDQVCKDVVPEFVMLFEDICFNSGPLISPDSFLEFLAPSLKQVISKAKETGIKGIIVDTDGNFHKMLPIYLDCGANAFYPFEVQAGMDIIELRKEYGNKFAIVGGLSKKTLAESESAIIEELEKKVPIIAAQGGFIPMFDHSIPPNVPLKLFQFGVDYIRNMFNK